MLKKRLVYTLLAQHGIIQQSRNFSLQAVGNLGWFRKYYSFDSMATSVDELVLLDVGRANKRTAEFAEFVFGLSERCFMPIAAGGGIAAVGDAYRLLDAGADKLVVNTALFDAPDLVSELVSIFGAQCLVASIDYRVKGTTTEVFTANGTRATGCTVEQALRQVEALGAGEIYLTSIDRDGTGQGYDVPMLERATAACRLPIIGSGGVGEFGHFVQGLSIDHVTGASTANIYNFMGDGLAEARRRIIAGGIPLARWDTSADMDSRARGEPE